MNSYIRFLEYKKFIQPSLIVLLCLIIYIPSLWNGFIWDDDVNLYKNPWIQKTDGLKVIWFTQKMYQYYPIDFTTFWLEHKLWGLNPFGYHTTNLILHILNALLFFLIVTKIYPRLAFISALLFAIHPIQVETVAWITERKNLLSLLFFLLAILAYLRFDRSRTIKYYLFTIVIFVCALLSKSIAVCFIFFPVLYKWWRDGKITWREIRVSLVFVIIGLLSAAYTLYLEFYHVGAQGKSYDLTFLERFILSGRIIFFYIYKLLFPFNFMFFYPHWILNTRIWWQWLFPFAVIFVLGAFVIYGKRIGRGALSLFIFYIISIFPVLGFLNVYGMRFSFVADHFSYLSTPALLLLLCATIGFFLDKLSTKFPLLMSAPYKIAMSSMLVIILIYMCAKGMALTQNYRSEVRLWEDLIRRNPRAWIAYNNLGTAYANSGNIEEAIVLYKKAVEINPDYEEAYNNLGTAYANSGNIEEALVLYKKALAINPDFAFLYYKLGNLYLKMARNEEAIDGYKKAIELKPDYLDAYNRLCNTYIIIGKNREAIEWCNKATQFKPAVSEVYYNLGNAYYNLGEREESIKAILKAIEIDPGNIAAYNNLAAAYTEIGKVSEAIKLWNKAVQLDPSFATAHFNLAVFYFQQKKYALAIEHCNKVIELGNRVDPKLLKLLKPYRK